MLTIQKIEHIGIRINDIDVSVAFYENLGFAKILDTGYEKGHPVIMQHASGVTLNLLGPANQERGFNVLMDAAEKYTGYTHIALRVESLEATRKTLDKLGIEITGSSEFGRAMSAIFIRDPDRNVIELDEVDESHLVETMVDHQSES